MLLEGIKYPFENIDKVVSYIQKTDTISQKSGEIIAKIQANSPENFIISSCQYAAMEVCKEIVIQVMKKVSNDYEFDSYTAYKKEIYFLNRKEEKFEFDEE